jgi:cytochrome c-type biogenesis protein CcmH
LTNRRATWALLVLVVVVALVIAFQGGKSDPSSPAKQADSIARGVRCPTCRGQSVAESAAPAAQAIRNEIRRRVDDGESRHEIEAYLEGRYGSDILLTPPGNGLGGLVWVIPVVVVAGAGAGLVMALRRWSRRSLAQATDADRLLVAQAEDRL